MNWPVSSPGGGRCLAAQRFTLRRKSFSFSATRRIATTACGSRQRRSTPVSLRHELPNLRSITVFGVGESGWQVLPVDAEDFEKSVLLACALVRAGDPRIGKVPKPRKAAERRSNRSARSYTD